MSLAYPGESKVHRRARRLSGGVGRSGTATAHLRKIAENLDDALNMASRLKAFDIMGSTGPEAQKGKSRFVRAAADSK